MDGIQLVAVVSALVLDVMVLGAMIARIGGSGSPESDGSARPQPRPPREPRGRRLASRSILRGRSTLHRLERCADHLPSRLRHLAAAVVVILPPLFAFD